MSTDQAEAEFNRLVKEGQKAVKDMNKNAVAAVEAELSKFTGVKGKAEIETSMVYKADGSGFKVEQTMMTQNLNIARKKAKVEVGSLVNLQKRLSKEVQSRNNIQQIVQRTGLLSNVLKTRVNPEWAKANQTVRKLQQKIDKINASSGKGGLSKVLSVGNKMQQVVGGFTAVGVALQGVNAAVQPIIGRQKDIQALKLTLEGVGVTVEGQNAVLKSATAVSLKYGQSVQRIEGAYKRLTPAILEQGGSLGDTEKAIETISARTASLGLNTEQTGRYIEAFAQVMGKGKLQGEELNQQFSELDGALRGQLKTYFAANEGITNFEEAMRNGEITSQKFLTAINAISENLRDNMAREAQNAQKGIESLGEKGGLTIQQLNNQMQTLTKMGLGAIAKPLAPLGKSLARIYAAFVQIFTKIATEMPGVQKFFTVLSEVVGRILEVGLNATLILFAKIVEALDWALQRLDEFVQFAMDIPIVGDAFRAVGGAMNGAMESLRNGIDEFSLLSEETTGATGKLEDYENTVANLKAQLDAGKITQEEYNQKINELNTQKAQQELQALQAEAAATQEALQQDYDNAKAAQETKQAAYDKEKEILVGMGNAIKSAIDKEIEQNNRAINSIKEKAAAEKTALDAQARAIKRNAAAAKAALDQQTEDVKAAAAEQVAAVDQAVSQIKSKYASMRAGLERQADAVNSRYDSEIEAIDRAKAAATAAHERRMSEIDRQRDAAVGAVEAEIQALEGMTPAEAALNKIRRERLMQTAMDPNASQEERLRAVAQLEREQRQLQIDAKRQQIKAIEAAAAKKKAAEEKKHQLEMEKLEEERIEREKQRNAALEKIAQLMEAMAEREKKELEEQKKKKEEIAEKEKEDLKEIDDKKKDVAQNEKDDLEAIAQRKREIDAEAMESIKALQKENQRLKDQKKLIDDKIKDATSSEGELLGKANATWEAFNNQVTSVSNLNTQLGYAITKASTLLSKLNSAKKASADLASGPQGGSAPPNAFSGGPVAGGHKRIVNELGQEGFLSASGKLSAINAPAWGEWRAPGAGTIIPAHLYSQIKADRSGTASGASISAGVTNSVSSSNSLIRALSSLGASGDAITNNVTIQAANTTQAASDMLVQLTKVRNRRFR